MIFRGKSESRVMWRLADPKCNLCNYKQQIFIETRESKKRFPKSVSCIKACFPRNKEEKNTHI